MKIFAFIKISDDNADLKLQRDMISDYCFKKKLFISDYINFHPKTASFKGEDISDILKDELSSGDKLLALDITKLGRNLLQSLNLMISLMEKGVSIEFINQPELSASASHSNSLLVVFKYLAEAERNFISYRTRQGLAAAQAKGKLLGRPKGSLNKKGRILDPFRNNIKYYLEINIPIQSILKLINRKLAEPVSYNALKYFIENDKELKFIKKNAAEENAE